MEEINLSKIITENPDCVANGAKLNAILLDTYPYVQKAVTNTLVIISSMGIANEIWECGQVSNFEFSRWQIKLENDFGLSEKYINLGLNMWIKAIADLRFNDFEIVERKLLKYKGSSQTVFVPDNITYIEHGAFKDCVNIKSITIPEGVKYIGDYSFENCCNLESISLPQSLEIIGYNAFWHCNKLKKTEFNNVLYIGNDYNPYLVALKAKDNQLEQYSLPNSTKIIYSNAFMDCTKIKKIELPQLSSIGTSAFTGCKELEEVHAKQCREIAEYAFSYCKKLRRVSIGGTINLIKKYAFENCQSIKKLHFLKPLIAEKNIFGERRSIKVKIGIRYDRDSPFHNNHAGNFRFAYERFVKHDIFADYSELSYSKYDIEDEYDAWHNYGRPSYSYVIK